MNPFSIQEVIKQRVNKEALYAWATKQEVTHIPKYEKPIIQKSNVGWFNFFRVLLP